MPKNGVIHTEYHVYGTYPGTNDTWMENYKTQQQAIDAYYETVEDGAQIIKEIIYDGNVVTKEKVID